MLETELQKIPCSSCLKSEQDKQDIFRLTEKVIGCAYRVYNTLGFGFLESVYEKSLIVELQKSGLSSIAQKAINVFYNEVVVGDFFADILIHNRLILELKSVAQLNQAHEVQLVNYLNATGVDDGLLINFGPQRVEVRRKYKTYKKPSPTIFSEKKFRQD